MGSVASVYLWIEWVNVFGTPRQPHIILQWYPLAFVKKSPCLKMVINSYEGQAQSVNVNKYGI